MMRATASMRNYSLLPTLPNLKLYQSAWYVTPFGFIEKMPGFAASADKVPPGITVAEYLDITAYAKYWTPIMADWVAASMFRWNVPLRENELAFRNCAWSADAPLSCPPMTSLTHRRSLRGMTFGIIGYGTVGTTMADYMSKLGMRVIASKRSGPFKPTPPGLAWLSSDNDRVWSESDFVLVSVPVAGMAIVNATALSLMKSTAVFITVNPLGDEGLDALYKALSSKSIGGAFVDAWFHGCPGLALACGPEYGQPAWPTPDKRLLELDNVQLTSNNLDQDDWFWSQSAIAVSANLKALVTGGPLSNVVSNGASLPVERLPDVSQYISQEASNIPAPQMLAQRSKNSAALQSQDNGDASSSNSLLLHFSFFGAACSAACFVLGIALGARLASNPHGMGSAFISVDETTTAYSKMAL